MCAECGGAGRIEIGAGFAALQSKYPELPIGEIARRGWFDHDPEGEDVERCDKGFLRFWGVEAHDEVRAIFNGKRRIQ